MYVETLLIQICVERTTKYEQDILADKNADAIERALRKGTSTWSRGKIVIMGDAGAGKTALAQAILGTTEAPLTAHGVNITIAQVTRDDGRWSMLPSRSRRLETALSSMIGEERIAMTGFPIRSTFSLSQTSDVEEYKDWTPKRYFICITT
jgi:GTPase SAR1 family protein